MSSDNIIGSLLKDPSFVLKCGKELETVTKLLEDIQLAFTVEYLIQRACSIMFIISMVSTYYTYYSYYILVSVCGSILFFFLSRKYLAHTEDNINAIIGLAVKKETIIHEKAIEILSTKKE